MEAIRDFIEVDTSKERREKVFITPSYAKKLLATDSNNRKLMKQKVERYAALMRSGNWTASDVFTISVDWNGHLIDGQHRLTAVVVTGLTVEMVIVSGCDPILRKYIDTGASRTTSQVITMTQDSPVVRSAAIQALVRTVSVRIDKTHSDFSPEELVQLINKRYYVYKHMYEAYISRFSKGKAMSNHVLLGMLSLEANNIRQDLLCAFYECLNRNEDAPRGRNGKAVRDFYDWYLSVTDIRRRANASFRTIPDEVYHRLQKAFYMFANDIKKTTKSGEIYPLTSAMLDELNKKFEETEGDK